MEQINRTREVSYTIYKAFDDTEFASKEECLKYEESALGVVKAKFLKLIVGKSDEWTLFGGSDEVHVHALDIKSEKDVDTVLQFYYLQHPYMKGESDMTKYEDMVNQALKDHDYLLMDSNYEGEFYFVNTVGNVIKQLEDMTKQ